MNEKPKLTLADKQRIKELVAQNYTKQRAQEVVIRDAARRAEPIVATTPEVNQFSDEHEQVLAKAVAQTAMEGLVMSSQGFLMTQEEHDRNIREDASKLNPAVNVQ